MTRPYPNLELPLASTGFSHRGAAVGLPGPRCRRRAETDPLASPGVNSNASLTRGQCVPCRCSALACTGVPAPRPGGCRAGKARTSALPPMAVFAALISRPGSARRTRTPTGCCASTSPRARTCPHTRPLPTRGRCRAQHPTPPGPPLGYAARHVQYAPKRPLVATMIGIRPVASQLSRIVDILGPRRPQPVRQETERLT
jgi:hypothetical protein